MKIKILFINQPS